MSTSRCCLMKQPSPLLLPTNPPRSRNNITVVSHVLMGSLSALAGRGGAATRSQLLHHQDHVAPDHLLAEPLDKVSLASCSPWMNWKHFYPPLKNALTSL